jgi:putative endonuclease
MNQRKLGGSYEQMAADFLSRHGYRILERNFRCRIGEIDIVARDGACLVFVEVKYRSSLRFGGPMAAVNLKKQRTISRVASFYLASHHLGFDTPCRFDVVGILPDRITVEKNAFLYTR